MAWAFSFNMRLKAVDATDLGSESAYAFPEKNMQNSAKNLAPSLFSSQKGEMGWS